MKTSFILLSTFLVLSLSCCLSIDDVEYVRTDEEQMFRIELGFYYKFNGLESFSYAWIFPDALIYPYYNALMNRIKNKELNSNYQSTFLLGATPLMLAVRLNDLEGIDYLLQNGADPNKTDNGPIHLNVKQGGKTALHYAALLNNSDAYKKLLEYGASENIRDSEGDTPKSVSSNQKARCLYSGYTFNEKFEIVNSSEM